MQVACAAGNEDMPWLCPKCKPECGKCGKQMLKDGVDYHFGNNAGRPGAPAWCKYCARSHISVLDLPEPPKK